mgnify:CR=1 FL=1
MEQVQQQFEKPAEENKEAVVKKMEKTEKKPVEKITPAAVKEPAREISKPVESAKAKVEEKKEGKAAKDEKKVEIVLKRTVVVPLVKAYAKPAKKRAAKAIKMLREYGARHAKTTIDKVKISEVLARFINARGSKKPPKKLKVTLLKDKQGNVNIAPA